MLPLPPRLGFFLLGTLAGLVLTLTLLPHYSPTFPPSSGPFYPDYAPSMDVTGDASSSRPVTLEDVVGGLDGSVEDDGIESGRGRVDVAEVSMGKNGSWLRGKAGEGLFGEFPKLNIRRTRRPKSVETRRGSGHEIPSRSERSPVI